MASSELSNEIRGERLRFVDAMKEATAINVQSQSVCEIIDVTYSFPSIIVHVEQLKEELAREVRADLFAFYSKQRQPTAVGCTYILEHPHLLCLVAAASNNVCAAIANGSATTTGLVKSSICGISLTA